MKILWVATKAPWPPVDGGRLLLWNTLGALRDAGHEVTLVAPVDPAAYDLDTVREALGSRCENALLPVSPRALWRDAMRSIWCRVPLTVARHQHRVVARRVAELLRTGTFDFVQVEQLQALSQVPPDSGRPCVMRAQNVESDLWFATAASPSLAQRWLRAPLLRWEARRLARWESAAVQRVAGVVALTDVDAARLGALAGSTAKGPSPAPAPIRVAPPPFVERLPAAVTEYPGEPAVILLGSAGWLPNRDGALWFVRDVWPSLQAVAPKARLHVFGLSLPVGLEAVSAVEDHGPLDDSREAFPRGAILVVPLAVASGIRMKIIEAWARGIPVVATPAAAGGLNATSGCELLIATSANEMATAVHSLVREPQRAADMVQVARDHLRRTYSPAVAVAALESAWSSFGLGGTSPKADEVMNSA